MSEALCADLPPEEIDARFFEPGVRAHPRSPMIQIWRHETWKDLCSQCPMRALCFRLGLEEAQGARHLMNATIVRNPGIWAGTLASERDWLVKDPEMAEAWEHMIEAGYEPWLNPATRKPDPLSA